MSGCYNFEHFAFLLSARSKYYVFISANSQKEIECCPVLTVPTPLCFCKFLYTVLLDDGGAPSIWHVAITEYVETALLRFLASVHDVVVGFTCVDPHINGHRRGVLVPLPSSVHHEHNDISLIKIIRGSRFYLFVSLIAHSRSPEVYWANVEPAQCWCPYPALLGVVL